METIFLITLIFIALLIGACMYLSLNTNSKTYRYVAIVLIFILFPCSIYMGYMRVKKEGVKYYTASDETEDYGKKGKFIWYVQQAILTGHDITVDSSNFTEGCYSVEYDGHVYGHPINCRKCSAEKLKRDSFENAAYSTIDTSKIKPIHPDYLKYIEAGYGHVYVRTSDGKMLHDPRCPNPFHKIEVYGYKGTIIKH